MATALAQTGTIRSFPPVIGEAPRVLILGSMPGARSLAADEYYAHPRNAFWPIMAALLGFDAALPYRDRLATLTAAGVALWDVLQSCVRPGSADSAIQRGTRTANDFPLLFQRYPEIRLVCFNGAEAERSFQREVRPSLAQPRFEAVRLPSTSPAYAALSLERKRVLWAEVIRPQLKVWERPPGGPSD